jgi:hypothetical protein
MSLLLDALRRLEVGPPAKFAEAPPPSRPSKPEPPPAPQRPRAVRVEEPVKPATEPPIPVVEREPTPVAERDFVADEAAGGESAVAPSRFETTVAKLDRNTREPAPAPPTWEAAYYVDKPTQAPIRPTHPAAEFAAERAAVKPAPANRFETTMETAAADSAASDRATRQSAPPVETAPVVELPRTGNAFDCRAVAAAVRRLRPSGGRIAFVSIGNVSSTTGVPVWSADLADELGGIAALPVERFASSGLALDHDAAPLHLRNAYRLYFVGAEFAAGRGALLRGLDGVLLVVHEGATSLKGAEVVRGALAAQSVEFAGFVYVAR